MDTVIVIKGSDMSITFSGYDMGGRGVVVHESLSKSDDRHVMVVRFPAGRHFAGRGNQAYHSPSIYVLEKNPIRNPRFRVVANWDVKRKSKE